MFQTGNKGCAVSKLKPMQRMERICRKVKLSELGIRYVFDKGIKHKLKVNELRQFPCRTPRPTIIKGIRNGLVKIDVQNYNKYCQLLSEYAYVMKYSLHLDLAFMYQTAY